MSQAHSFLQIVTSAGIKISYFLPVKTDAMRWAAPPCQDTHLFACLRAAAGRQLGSSSSTRRQKIIRRHSLNDPITHAARRCRVRVSACVSVNAEVELTPTQEIIKALLWLENSSCFHLRTFCWCNNAIQLEVAWEILSHYHICVYLTCSFAPGFNGCLFLGGLWLNYPLKFNFLAKSCDEIMSAWLVKLDCIH